MGHLTYIKIQYDIQPTVWLNLYSTYTMVKVVVYVLLTYIMVQFAFNPTLG